MHTARNGAIGLTFQISSNSYTGEKISSVKRSIGSPNAHRYAQYFLYQKPQGTK